MSAPNTVLHALSSNNVVLENEVVAATVVYSPNSGKIVRIIRKDSQTILSVPTQTPGSSSYNSSDDEYREYYDEDLETLNVSPENHRDIGDLVLMPGLVDAHVHLNEVSSLI